MIGLQKQCKRQLKNSKLIQKQLQDLQREVQAMNRKYQDRNNNHSSSSCSDYLDRKGKKWWARFDERNFAPVNMEEYVRLRNITTSDCILQQSPKQPLPFVTYPQHKIIPEYDLLAEQHLIHLLFKCSHPRYRCLASYELEPAASNPPEPSNEVKPLHSFKVTPSSSDSPPQSFQFRQIKLSLAGYNEEESVCRAISHYKQTLNKLSTKTQLERQLHLWEKQLHSINKDNHVAWDKLAKLAKPETPPPYSQEEILRIREYLMWVTVLKYFENGYSDKTTDQLNQLIQSQRLIKPAKSKDVSSSKKFFQTDCKICFCSFNYDSNQVLYCDSCNTSFHLACYGMQEIPKEDIYYCDACKFQKQQENVRQMACQLCNKVKFPIKHINGHFYHVTCLMFFNLVCIQQGALVLRPGLTHNKILQMIVESELTQEKCQFCSSSSGPERGIRMRCSYAGCRSSAHPICAYINGCKFWIKRDSKNQKIQTSYHCNNHNFSRDWIQQTYLRRYMCNFKKTSELKEHTFREQYKEQMQNMQKCFQSRNEGKNNNEENQNKIKEKIIAKTKFMKWRFAQEEQKSTNNCEVQTESRKMLQKLYKKKY